MFLDVFTNSLVLLIVNSNLINGANKLAKYYIVLYVAVPILNTIGLNVKSSMLLVESLCTLPSHRTYQGKVLLGKDIYKHFQVVLILFSSMFIALYLPIFLLNPNLILKIVLFLT